MSKYRLPNGLILNLDDETGETTVVSGGGRTVAPGARVTDTGILGKPPTGDEPRAVSRPSSQEKDQTDDELGIASPLARPTGRVFRGVTGDTNPAPLATDVSAPPEAPLVKEDPIGNAIVGAGALKAGAAAARAIPGVVGAAAEGATAAGVPVLAETGDPKQAARAALAGVGVGTAAHVLPAIPGAIGDAAAARNVERIPTAVTGGATSKAAKGVVAARDVLRETAQAHPDLQNVILSGDDAAKHSAISSKLDSLTAANDADVERIANHHPNAVGGRVPAGPLYEKLRDFAAKAHEAGDESLLEATSKAIDSVQKFEAAGTISPSQLRGVRNGLAKKIAGAAPLGQSARETAAVKSVLNDALSDLADETPGLYAAALKTRNRQIASLLPAQSFLEEKAEREAGKVPGKLAAVARAVAHPTATLAHAAEQAPSMIDVHLAKLAGNSGPAGVAALKAVALSPTRDTLQAAVRAGVTPQIALQVARLGAAQPGGAQ